MAKKTKRKSRKVTRITQEQKANLKCEYIVEYRKGTRWNQRPEATYRYMA